MLQQFFRAVFTLTLMLVLAVPAIAENGMAIDPATCLQCHDDVVRADRFAGSVHGKNACTSCHVEITDVDLHADGKIEVGTVKCVRCHKQETAEHYASVHMLNDVACADCHTDIHSHTYWQQDKRKVVDTCGQCHEVGDDYLQSSHGIAVTGGNQDSAACNDCHNLHET